MMTTATQKQSSISKKGKILPFPVPRRKPSILVIGDARRIDTVIKTLNDLHVDIQTHSWSDEIYDYFPDNCQAIVLIDPIKGRPASVIVEQLRDSDKTREIAIFVLLSGKLTERKIHKIYSAGSTAVFKWPAEASHFVDVFTERLGIALVRGITEEADTSLARTVQAYLRAVGRGIGRIKVNVNKDIAYVSGPVSGLWKMKELETLVRQVPGIRSVVSRAVYVEPTEISDEDLVKAIQSILKVTSKPEAQNIIFSVNEGFVVLRGALESRVEIERLCEIISHIRGVRGIDNRLTVQIGKRPKTHTVERRLRKAVAKLVRNSEVTVSVFGNVAVLRGSVEDAETRFKLEQFVSQDDHINSVIDMIVIS